MQSTTCDWLTIGTKQLATANCRALVARTALPVGKDDAVMAANGWSARGLFRRTIPAGNPLEGTTPIGFYCCHADMPGDYGEHWVGQVGHRGFLHKNRWYCIEELVQLNTPAERNRVLRGWVDGFLAYEKTDIRFRSVDRRHIEQLWVNVCHGGTLPSPHDQHCYMDNVVVADQYIGPMAVEQ
jgi:hypothetical protein